MEIYFRNMFFLSILLIYIASKSYIYYSCNKFYIETYKLFVDKLPEKLDCLYVAKSREYFDFLKVELLDLE